MTALLIISIILCGLWGLLNLVGTFTAEDDMAGICLINFLVCAFAILVAALALGRIG